MTRGPIRRAFAGVIVIAWTALLVACRADLPMRAMSAPAQAQGAPTHPDAATAGRAKLALALRASVLPAVRREDPLRIVVDLADQPDWAAISRELEASSPTRQGRKARAWERLADLDLRRVEFLTWLQAQEGVGGIRRFRCANRVAFDGNELIVRALAERDDVAWIWGRLPIQEPLPPSVPRGEGTTDAGEVSATWALDALGAGAAWKDGVRGEGVVVAVMDSGVTGRHASLAGRLGTPVRDDAAGQPDPGQGHGTAVLAAAVGEGIGVAPGARWTAVNALAAGHLDPEMVAASVDWLLETGRPDVVVIPWDAPDDGPADLLAVPLGALRCAGMALVFPAGNSGPQSGFNRRPANLTGLGPDGAAAFSVGGVTSRMEPYQFGCRGPNAGDGSLFPLVCAPAVNLVIADDATGGTRIGHGTSYAAGLTAGALALVLSARPAMTGPEAERLLASTARDVGEPGPDAACGHGLIDVGAALASERQRRGRER